MKVAGKGRFWLRLTAWFGSAVLLAVLSATLLAWHLRLPLTTRLIYNALAKEGIEDISFRLTRLTPWRLTLEDLYWGQREKPLLFVKRLEAHYSLSELRAKHLERLHLDGARTSVILADGLLVSPLYQRLQSELDKFQAKRSVKTVATESNAKEFSLWMATARNICITLESTSSAPLADATITLGMMAEQPERYRLWGQLNGQVSGTNVATIKVTGAITPANGGVTLSPTVDIKAIGTCMEFVQNVTPTLQLPQFALQDSTLRAHGDLSLLAWTNIQPFKVSAELGRNALLTLPGQDSWIRLQSLRCEVAGTPHDLQARLNAGVAGFSLGKGKSAVQERGRLLSMRATAHYQRLTTNQTLTAVIDSDLPGRSVATLLPRLLPIVPVFFTDGGVLKVESELHAPLGNTWQGDVKFAANAQRSSLPMPDIYLGANLVTIKGALAIADSQPGRVESTITLQDGYCFKDGVVFKGNITSTLHAMPPYETANGNFNGQLDAEQLLGDMNIAFDSGYLPFTGTMQVVNLISNPLWQVKATLPESRVTLTQGVTYAEAVIGATTEIEYGANTIALHGKGWLHGLQANGAKASVESDNPTQEALFTSSLKQLELSFALPHTPLDKVPQTFIDATLKARGAMFEMPNIIRLTDGAMQTPFAWSKEDGFIFKANQELSWRELKMQELEVAPTTIQWSADKESITSHLELKLRESALKAALTLYMPLSEPQKTTISVDLPETVIKTEDSLATFISKHGKGAKVSGEASALLNVRFLGSQPHVTGRLKLKNGSIKIDEYTVNNIALDVPFVSGVIFRTIEKPFVSFGNIGAGNVHLDKGHINFQITRRGLFIESAEMGMCKGHLHAYAVEWDFKNPQSNFIVYADRIDLGEVLMMAVPFEGRMEGVLYGRVPVKIEKGDVKLSTGFLYSLPGQGGKLRMNDNRQMRELLENSGIRGEMQEPLSKALSDMDFSMLRFELEPREDGEGTLRIKLVGKSNHKEWPAPVDLNLNLHGQLEKLINIGLDMSRKK